MKKTLLILLFLTLGLGVIFVISNQETELEKSRKKHIAFLKNHPYNKLLKLSKKERLAKGLPPNKYFEQMHLLQMNPKTGKTYPENLRKVQQELAEKRKLQKRTPGDDNSNSWVERGPNNVGGRTRTVLFDPNDNTHKRVFAGGVSGGLWVNNDITDANSSWTQVGIPENLAINCMTVDPNNTMIMYIGTGEPSTSKSATGNGVWKSVDGGNTWTHIYAGNGSIDTNFDHRFHINDIQAWNNGGHTEVFFTTTRSHYYYIGSRQFPGHRNVGLYKTTDGGINWNYINTGASRYYDPNDIEVGADNSIYVSYRKGEIVKSTNGTSFSKIVTLPNVNRVEMVFSTTTTGKAYILAEGTSSPIVMLRTTDDFRTTTAMTLPNDADRYIPANDFARGQAFHNLVIEVNPIDDNIIYAGGIDWFRSTNAGSNWTQISRWHKYINHTCPVVHADQHALTFHPANPDKAILGNDGGVYYVNSLLDASRRSETAIASRNKDYNVTQFHKGAIGQNISAKLLLAGAQDNGTQFVNGASPGVNSANDIRGGDGMYCFIDKDGDYLISSHIYNNRRLYYLPYTGNYIQLDADQASGEFVNPQELDHNLDILYSNALTKNPTTYKIRRYTNIKTSPTRQDFTHPLLTGSVSVLKVSPYTTTSSKLFVGTSDGKLIKISRMNTATPSWESITTPSSGSISSVEFGKNENEILLTYHNYGIKNIWYSNDGGNTWQNKEGNLPDIPVITILMNPLNDNEVILGTELGVWTTSNFKDSSPRWNQSYNGMSNVRVTSFDLRTSDNTVLATTYGRGMFTGKFKAETLNIWTGKQNTSWQNSNNWTNGVPTINSNVKINNTNNKPVINTPVTVNNIEVATDAKLTVQDTGSLTVNNDLTNNGELLIDNTNLLVKRTFMGNNIIYRLNLSDKWHLITNPFTGQDIDNFVATTTNIARGSTNPNNRGLGTYNNGRTNQRWSYYQAGSNNSGDFKQGGGYSIKLSSPGSITFKGGLTNYSLYSSISVNNGNSFNLVGNPFSTSIHVNNLSNSTHNLLKINDERLAEKTIWIWDGTANAGTGEYIAVNQLNGDKISPGQGFFVKSSGIYNTIKFTKEMQTVSRSSFYRTATQFPKINLKVVNGSLTKNTQVYYINDATTGFDNGYDSSIFSGVNEKFSVFTNLVDKSTTQKLAIQSLPNDSYKTMVIPLGIKASKESKLIFNADITGMPSEIKVYLEDKVTGKFTDVSKDNYTIILDRNIDGIGRFYIHTVSRTLTIDNQKTLENITVFNTKNTLKINGLQAKGNIKIFSLLGNKVYENTFEANAINTFFLPEVTQGIYIVKLSSDKGDFSKKIIIE